MKDNRGKHIENKNLNKEQLEKVNGGMLIPDDDSDIDAEPVARFCRGCHVKSADGVIWIERAVHGIRRFTYDVEAIAIPTDCTHTKIGDMVSFNEYQLCY